MFSLSLLSLGIILNMIGRWQALDQLQRPGSTVIKLAVNIGNAFTHHLGIREALPQDAYFDDDLFFEVSYMDVFESAQGRVSWVEQGPDGSEMCAVTV